jgi:dTDP-4-dehydrorhamnose 3,5-epimerase
MNLIKTDLEGVFIIENFYAEDIRGSFTKTYHESFFLDNKLCTNFKESYFSTSNKDVIRGMHFQLPPHDHEKLVYVVRGEVMDVILDLRKSSKTYGKAIEVSLSDRNHNSIYIPKGLAHGFKAKENKTIMVYNVATTYNKDHDFGIKYDSFDFDWKIETPILSDRDRNFITFKQFDKQNPF